MSALIFLSGSIVLQIAAAAMAIRLIRATGRQAAWVLISIALALMALRRAIEEDKKKKYRKRRNLKKEK